MYTLYFSPGACSLATHTILNLLGQPLKLVHAGEMENFEQINQAKLVPVLADGDKLLTEGAAIILHLLDKHENTLIAGTGIQRQQAIENMMMANATVHPAYGRLFFASNSMPEGDARNGYMDTAANAINDIWKRIENKLAEGPYLGGDNVSPADILLAVYSRWGQFFEVNINIGPKAQKMISLVLESDAFKLALHRETQEAADHAA